ncbi:AAA family ATPase [Luteolibacter sp. Populi]|uniref:AAA family ATPase n=1 Tax=Luteolibacter sp. Populi TaxID=3230487 RepID=UPI0034650107
MLLETVTHTPPSFPILRADALGESVEPDDFVEGLLTDGGASLLYGPSNVGKSFLITDLCAAVAAGRAWRYGEIAIEQGAVVYVALEGTRGLKNRLEAMRREGLLAPDAPFYVCTAPVSLLERDHAAMLARSVKEAAQQSALPCRLVVLDTLARAMAGGNENAGEDMSAAVASIDAVRAATGAHVCIIHHCGKDEARGARGHSSLRAAVDTELEIFRPSGERISTLRVTKQRDLECRDPMPFSLKVVELRMGRRDKPVTSCVVKHEDEMMAGQPVKRGGSKCTPEEMLEFLPAATTQEWLVRVKEETGLAKTQFYENRALLLARKLFRRAAGTNELVRE